VTQSPATEQAPGSRPVFLPNDVDPTVFDEVFLRQLERLLLLLKAPVRGGLPVAVARAGRVATGRLAGRGALVGGRTWLGRYESRFFGAGCHLFEPTPARPESESPSFDDVPGVTRP